MISYKQSNDSSGFYEDTLPVHSTFKETFSMTHQSLNKTTRPFVRFKYSLELIAVCIKSE